MTRNVVSIEHVKRKRNRNLRYSSLCICVIYSHVKDTHTYRFNNKKKAGAMHFYTLKGAAFKTEVQNNKKCILGHEKASVK